MMTLEQVNEQLRRELAQAFAEIEAQEHEEADNCELITSQGVILNAVADALHGGPLKDGWWSHHDLGQISTKMRSAVEQLLYRSEQLCAALGLVMGREVNDPLAEEIRGWLKELRG
jgi:hypothetical protein